MSKRLYFDLLTANTADQGANEETKGNAAHPSAAAMLGTLTILMPPGSEVAPLSMD